MTELSPGARALIDAATGAEAPTVEDKLRVQDSLYTKLGIGAAGIATTGAASSSAAGGGGSAGPSSLANVSSATVAGSTSAGAAVATKVGLAVVAVAGLAVGGYYLWGGGGGKDRQPESTPVVSKTAVDTTEPVENRVYVDNAGTTTRSKKVAVDKPVTAPAPSPLPKRRVRRIARRPRVVTKPPATKPRANPMNALIEEKRLLTAAQTASRDGDHARALTILTEHATKFPNGILAPERQGTRVLVLCKLGRTAAAKNTGRSFLHSWPRHPMAQRVQRSCANDNP